MQDLLNGRLKPIWLVNRAVQEVQPKLLDDNPVTEKDTDSWAWAVTVLQMYTGVLVQNHVQARALFERYKEFVRVVIEMSALRWKGDQIAEHLSPVIDAHIQMCVKKGGTKAAEEWKALEISITRLPVVSELRSSIGDRTVMNFLMATLVKDVPELLKFKSPRLSSKVAPKISDGKDRANKTTSLHDFFDPLLTWCVTKDVSRAMNAPVNSHLM